MTKFCARIDIPATSTGPAAARAVVRAVLPGWGAAHLVSDAELVVSELVTNAYRYATRRETVELELLRHERGLRIELVDGSALRPVVKQVDADAPNGRGMTLVQALSSDWGADDNGAGKRVWVELSD